MKRILKSYLFWTYPRGSFHYDVMVTLILVFIFASPFLINYRERPQAAPASAGDVMVRQDGPDAFVYEIDAGQIADGQVVSGQVKPDQTAIGTDDAALRAKLLARVQAISGAVEMDSYAAQKDASGRVIGYRVWAHR